MAYSYYHALTISSGQMPGTETDFPVLISDTHASLKTVANGGKVQNANGYDIAFYSDSALTTQLKHEIESYNAATGAVIYHVKVPSAAVGTVIYRAFGDSGISTSQADPENTWNSAYKGVYHLPDGSSLTVLDSTGNNNDGTAINSPTAITGKINGGGDFNGTTQLVELPITSIDAAQTLQAWVKSNSVSQSREIFALNYNTTDLTYRLYVDTNVIGASRVKQNVADQSKTTAFTDTASFHHVAAIFDGSNMYISLDGTRSTATAYSGSGSGLSNSKVSFGASYNNASPGSAQRWFNGQIDEVRFSNVARSANWITSEYNNQSAPSSFYSVGADVSTEVTTDSTQSSTYRIEKTTDTTQTTVYRIQTATESTQTGKWRIQATTDSTQTSIWSITITTDSTQSSIYRIQTTTDSTKSSKWSIIGTTDITQSSTYRIQTATDKDQYGKWAIAGIGTLSLIFISDLNKEAYTAYIIDENFQRVKRFADQTKTEVALKANIVDVVYKSLYNAATVLVANADNTPVALYMDTYTVLTRIAGDIYAAYLYTDFTTTNNYSLATSAAIKAYADALVAETITNGVTGIAPSQDAVFDALALKIATSVLDTDGTLAANSDAKIATQKATKTYADAREVAAKAYADTLVVGLIDDRGNYNASVNTFPASGGSGTAGAILKGDLWTVSVAGTLGGHAVTAGDLVRALTDTPGQTDANWAITENNIGYVAENASNKDTDGTLAANSDTKYASQKAAKTYSDLKLAKASNLSDVANAATSFTNIKQAASLTATGVRLLPSYCYLFWPTQGNQGSIEEKDIDYKVWYSGSPTILSTADWENNTSDLGPKYLAATTKYFKVTYEATVQSQNTDLENYFKLSVYKNSTITTYNGEPIRSGGTATRLIAYESLEDQGNGAAVTTTVSMTDVISMATNDFLIVFLTGLITVNVGDFPFGRNIFVSNQKWIIDEIPTT